MQEARSNHSNRMTSRTRRTTCSPLEYQYEGIMFTVAGRMYTTIKEQVLNHTQEGVPRIFKQGRLCTYVRQTDITLIVGEDLRNQ